MFARSFGFTRFALSFAPDWRGVFVGVAFAIGVALTNAAHAAPLPWRITKTEWTAADEKGFGEFLRKLAESGCDTTISCLKSAANPYRDTDPPELLFRADCAKFVYMLRAYYAWKNGLPFAYVDYITGSGADLRFTATSNAPISRHDLVDPGGGIQAVESLKRLHDKVWTATFRMDPAQELSVTSDFYAPKLAPGSIRPGTVIYNITGHVGIVYEITKDGRILYLDAHPDETVRRSAYGPQFGQSPQRLGGGFKNFRPMKLVNATRREDGTYIGGRVVVATNAEIADVSLEQYRGNVPGAAGDGPDARFQYNGAPLGLFGYVRASMSSGGFTLNPVYELTMSMRTLCDEVKERSIQVNMSVASGIASRPHPGLLPGNVPGSDNAEWEEHASLAADARLRNSVAELYRSVEENIRLWQAHDLRIAYDGPSLKDALEESFEREARSCAVTYKNSDGKVIALTLGDVILRLNSLGFDPYHCIERRWGAVSAEELASCKDDETKTRWYMAEQRLRNQAEAAHSERPALTLSELDAHAPGSGTDAWPPVHIEALIENMI